jgi:hypothetical protein
VRLIQISYLFGASVGISVSQAVLFRSALQDHSDINEVVALSAGQLIVKNAVRKALLVSLVAAAIGFCCQLLVGHL